MDSIVEIKVPCRSRLWHVKEPPLLKAISAKHRSKFAALSPIIATAAG
jgi:hypothetical protein